MTTHFLSIDDIDAARLSELLDAADAMKASRVPSDLLAGRSVAMIFEKPSTRTRISFEVGITELGAKPVVLNSSELQLGRGETVEDTARVLSRYCHAIVCRTFAQERLEQLASAGTVPVINALSDHEHPCQALADLQTIRERLGTLQGVRLAYVGDGNNVANSLLLAGAMAGMSVVVAHPPGHGPDDTVVARAADLGSVEVTTDPVQGVRGAQVVYTDVWASMGQEAEADQRARAFVPYRVDADLMAQAADGALVMHCLPAHRGEEIAADVIDGATSVVWDQAENRLHAQKALMAWLLG